MALTHDGAQWIAEDFLLDPSRDYEMALYTTPVARDGSGTEVSGGGYARQTITFDTPTDGVASNDIEITYDNLQDEYITHVAVWETNTSMMVLFGPLSSPISTSSGDDVVFEVGDVVLSLY